MAAEEKLSAVLEKELDAIDKDCIRPLQVKPSCSVAYYIFIEGESVPVLYEML